MINIFGLLLLCVAVVTAAPAAGTKAAPTIASIYAKCANPTSSKFCVGTTIAKDADCIGTSGGCDVLVAYERTSEGKHNFDLITKEKTGYAVLAFSDDNQDGGDSMIVCQKSSDLLYPVKKYKAEGSVLAIVELPDENDLAFAYNGVSEDHIICSLTVENAVTYNEKVINLDGSTEYFLFAASGPQADNKPAAPTSTAKSTAPYFKLKEVEVIYNKCGDTKYTCFGTSSGTTDDTKTCVPAKNCKVLTVYEKVADNKHKYDLITKQADGYGAVGFTEDLTFGGGAGDGVVVCQFKTGTEAEVSKYKYYGTAFTPEATVTDISETSGKVAEEHLICTFTLANTVKFDTVTVSLAGDTGYHLFAGYGDLDSGAPGVLVGKVVSPDSYFKDSQSIVKEMYALCAQEKTDCVGGYTTRRDESSVCIQDQNCDFFVVYQQPLTDTAPPRFKLLSGYSSEYIAIAFSDDQLMGDDSVVQCLPGSSQLQPVLKSYTGAPPNNHVILIDSNQDGVTTVEASRYETFMYCELTMDRTVRFSNRELQLDQNEEYYLLVATGPAQRDGNGDIIGIGYHYGRTSSSSKLFKHSSASTPTRVVGSMSGYFNVTFDFTIFH